MELPEQRIDLRQWLRIIWRRRYLLLAVIALIPAAIYMVSALLPERYEAATTLRLQSSSVGPSSSPGSVAIASPSSQGIAALIETDTVARRAAELLGESTRNLRSLTDDVSAAPREGQASSGQTAFFTITAQADEGAAAAQTADAFARALADVRTERGEKSIDTAIRVLERKPPASIVEASAGPRAAAAELQVARQLQQLRVLRANQKATTQIVDSAATPSSPIAPQPLRNAAVGLVLSLLLAAVLIPLLRALDGRLHQARDAAELAGAPLLAQIPHRTFAPARQTTHSLDVKEAFQTLHASLTYFNPDRTIDSLLVASPGSADGKSTVAMNLAIASAEAGVDTVLVDADLRHAPLARRFGLDPEHGLDSVLLDGREIEETLVAAPNVQGGRLRLVGAGSNAPNPPALLSSARMRSALSQLSERSDLVIIDTPPLLAVSDALPLLSQVSGIVLVVRLEHTTRESLLRAREVIESSRGRIVGIAITAAPPSPFDRYEYGYSEYGYRDGAGRGDGDASESREGVSLHRNRDRRRSETTSS